MHRSTTTLLPSTPTKLTAATWLGRSRDGLYEPALADSEREAVADLLQYLENVGSYHHGDRHMLIVRPERRNRLFHRRAVTLTEHSRIFRECRSATKCELDFCGNHRTRYGSRCRSSRLMLTGVGRCSRSRASHPTANPFSPPERGYRGAASCKCCVGQLGCQQYISYPDEIKHAKGPVGENKVLIVSLGGLSPLIRQMMSPNVEVQCNAVGCITNLATHEDNKAKIARSGALGPLTRLAKSRDPRVQRNATGALLNMTHSGWSDDLSWCSNALI